MNGQNPPDRVIAVLEEIRAALADRPLAERSTPFTLPELAERWRCDTKTVERLCTGGAVKSFKPGRTRLVRPSDVAKYERAQTGGIE